MVYQTWFFIHLKTGRVENVVPFENDAVVSAVQIPRNADEILPIRWLRRLRLADIPLFDSSQ